jgi:hypothetical protein
MWCVPLACSVARPDGHAMSLTEVLYVVGIVLGTLWFAHKVLPSLPGGKAIAGLVG